MYKYFFATFILFSIFIFGQNSTVRTIVNNNVPKSYPIAGSDLLRAKDDSAVAKFLKDNPGYFAKRKLMKTASLGFTVGTQKSWLAYNFSTDQSDSVPSTCKAVGKHCYIFVANNVWGTYVDSTAVLAVMNEFDNHTPADSNKGIYQTDVDTFGNPPNQDGDSLIVILILDIQDGYNGTGGYVAGYFSSSNELPPISTEIYFMDCNPTNLKTSDGLNTALSTCAHEFQHMINFNYHYNFNTGKSYPELTFVNEGLSMVAEMVCGYPASMQSLYAGETNHYLFDWRGSDATLVLNDYARAQRFFLYLKEQFGVGILKQIVLDQQNYGAVGIQGLNNVLGVSHSTSLGKVFLNWEIANALNNTSVDSAYGYIYQPLPLSTGTVNYNPNDSTSSTLQNEAADYYTFTNSSNLKTTFTATDSNIIVKALEIGTGSSRVLNVPLNTAFNEPYYPSQYNTIRFALIDTNLTATQAYKYTSSGDITNSVTELKWDTNTPSGYFSLTQSDTVCVQFDAFNGGTLDSIKVALPSNTTTMTGGVWQYTGGLNPSPLGKKLVGPLTAKTSLNPNFPSDPWININLTSDSISTNQPFAVGFVIGSNNSSPLLTNYASSSAYHSYTYLQTPDKVTKPGWYYITTGSDTVGIYLIRAYVGVIVSGIKQEVEVTPQNYSLLQNYPNPFNPSTRIEFTLPATGKVKISVYNQLGQLVKTITDRVYPAGSNEILFNGENLPSGVYFYRIESGTFSETKKMVLLK